MKILILFAILLVSNSQGETCGPQIDTNNKDEYNIYLYGPSHLFSSECQTTLRRSSLITRGLPIESKEEATYWKKKDSIQNLRNNIRIKMIKLGFSIAKYRNIEIDVSKYPEIKKMLTEYSVQSYSLKQMLNSLLAKYGKDTKRYEAYAEQQMIIQIKNIQFKGNISSLRRNIIEAHLEHFDPEYIKTFKVLQNTKSSHELRLTVDHIIENSLDKNSDPNENPRHYLNYLSLQFALKDIILHNRGTNPAGTQIESSSDADEDKLIRAIYFTISRELIEKLESPDEYIYIFAMKNRNAFGLTNIHADYNGNQLLFQILTNVHTGDEIPGFDENSNMLDKKLKTKFDFNRFSATQRNILLKSKSLTRHPELRVDMIKNFRFDPKYSQLFE